LLWEWKAKYDRERILFVKEKNNTQELNYKTYEITLKPSVENINLILEKILPFVEKIKLLYTKDKLE